MTKKLLFDLDGTLTNNHAGISRSIRHALEKLGHAAPHADALAGVVGPPLRLTFARLLATGDAQRIEAAIAHYRERYREFGWAENEVYEGVALALAELRDAGFRLFLCTSKPRVFAERILARFDLAQHFSAVYGPELDGRFDHKDELLAHLLAAEKLSAHECLMIGDREHDALAAKANGVQALGVLYGFGSREELETAGVIGVVEAAAEIPQAVGVWARGSMAPSF